MENLAVLVIAAALDMALGDPPNAFHPVAWLGRLIGLAARAPVKGKKRQFAYGMTVVISITGTITAGMYILLAYLHGLNPAAYVIAGALVLKSAFTVKGLRSAAVSVRKLLAVGKSQQARYEVRSLVGRETEKLDDSQVASAVVESVAENSCDSLVAPLLYFLVFGIPGAVAYRIINTFDAMIGHHGRYEYLGKFAARLDDAANYIPARLSALLLAAAAGIARFDMAGAWRTMRRDHRLTESPNGGWTMSAAAGALGLTLEKAGYYRLGEGGETPTVTAIDRSLILLTVQASLWLTLCLAVEVTRAACA